MDFPSFYVTFCVSCCSDTFSIHLSPRGVRNNAAASCKVVFAFNFMKKWPNKAHREGTCNWTNERVSLNYYTSARTCIEPVGSLSSVSVCVIFLLIASRWWPSVCLESRTKAGSQIWSHMCKQPFRKLQELISLSIFLLHFPTFILQRFYKCTDGSI